jgi:tRNA(fMet)-specific endonuclease VapC
VTEYLIDTDWIVDCLHGQPDATQTLVDLAPRGLSISLITYGELYQGAYYARDPDAALRGLRQFLRGKSRLPLTRAIMQRFAVVRGALPRQLQQGIGDMDLLIAATALQLGSTLAYWMISVACCRTDGGMVRPIACAVLRLITKSKVVGCSTGRSAGLVPLRILSTYVAARRNSSGVLAP